MLIRSLVCKTPAEYPQILQQATELAASSGAELYLLFTDPYVFVTCDVERAPYRTPDYPYRVDKTLLLRCVPTLIKWEAGRCSVRLNDVQCQSVAALEEFFQSA